MKFTVTLSDASYAELHHLLNYVAAIPVVPQAGTSTFVPAPDGSRVLVAEAPANTQLETYAAAVPNAEPAKPTLTVEKVRAELNPYLDGPAGKLIKALCGEYSKKGLPGIPADKLGEFLEKARAIVEDHKEKA